MEEPSTPPLSAVLAEARADAAVLGVLLQGSRARGDALPGADLDLFVLLRPGGRRAFHAEERDGVWLERHFADPDSVRARLRAAPPLAYGFIEGRILHDSEGELAAVVRFAGELLRSYRAPAAEIEALRYWLGSARRKIAAALAAGDGLRASYVAATTSWKVLEGIWAVNDLPVPPSGALPARLGDLRDAPPEWPALFARLFQGDDRVRVDAALQAIDWILAHPEPPSSS